MKIIKEKSTGKVVYFLNDNAVATLDAEKLSGEILAYDINSTTHEIELSLPELTEFKKYGNCLSYIDGVWAILNAGLYDYFTALDAQQKTSALSPIQFKLRFTAPERVAIYQSADLIVKDFISLLDDIRLKEVDLTLQSTIDAVDYLISLGLIEVSRKDEILL